MKLNLKHVENTEVNVKSQFRRQNHRGRENLNHVGLGKNWLEKLLRYTNDHSTWEILD